MACCCGCVSVSLVAAAAAVVMVAAVVAVAAAVVVVVVVLVVPAASLFSRLPRVEHSSHRSLSPLLLALWTALAAASGVQLQAAQELLGHSSEEMVGQPLAALMPEEIGRQFRAAFEVRLREQGKGHGKGHAAQRYSNVYQACCEGKQDRGGEAGDD